MRYAKIENGRIVFAPKTLVVDGRLVSNPTRAMYRAAGWKVYVDLPASKSAPQGMHWERDGWLDLPDMIRPRWRLATDAAPAPRVFVTADLVEQLMQSGVWEQARAWIVEKGMLDLVLATKEFDETNENFAAGRAALQSALGWTDEEVEELLAKCVKEDV